ncbi:acetyl-CoA synthetase-like protein [Gymnopus androsaceus JB14]|uniref:Acetyl-CoA synthetase-like protein n=1 Tax=Gymnopus androsaceus JB14 TaxID=1447944 RepID=A0A6A4ISR6_9AGAR|nr:acetyl-CoA synthetase-like protein [Gymnopus androsaceus JB14]
MFRTHLSVLDSSAACFSSSPVFKLPLLDAQTNQLSDWTTITYQQFRDDVERSSAYWAKELRRDGYTSAFCNWIGGYTYTDVLHIYGLSRAGYIPQLFSLRLPNPEVIFELMVKANAKALVYDETFSNVLDNCHVPIYPAKKAAELNAGIEPLPSLPVVTEDDIAFVFHTSGSTSGSPKLVPCSYRWLDTTVAKSGQISTPRNAARQDVTSWMGSMCHIGQTFMLLGSLQHGSCVIQPTTISFSSEELIDMIQRCGLNRLNQFAAFLAMQIRTSRDNSKLLSMLTGLDEVLYSGMPLPREEQEFAFKAGINIRNLFGSTECGATLISIGGSGSDAFLLRPLEGVSYQFIPVDSDETEGGHQSTARLLEFVVSSESGDCPDRSLRHSLDGHFHTGDLFQEASPGCYLFRGRGDDWIKSENSLRCDTKAIEDNVRAMCGNLVAECIVVGTGRPSPVLFIEPTIDMDHEKLKKDIIRKTRQFHSRRYLHERICSAKMIVVVARNTLPRTATKGNIRRKAVEEAYRTQLDEIYGIVR